jgi:hypothetical protein
MGIDEYDRPLVFIPGDNPVSAGLDLAFNFGRVGDNLELPDMLTRFPALSIGGVMRIEDPIEVNNGIEDDVSPKEVGESGLSGLLSNWAFAKPGSRP